MATQQPIFLFASDLANNAATEYININSKLGTWDATEANRIRSFSTGGGTLKKLNIKIDTDPTSAGSWVFTLRINETTDSALTLTFGDGVTTGSIETDVSISAGDTVSLKLAPTSSPVAFTVITANLIWEPTTDNKYAILGGSDDGLNSGVTNWNFLESTRELIWNGTELNREAIIPVAGVISDLHVALSATPTGSENYIFALRVNEVTPSSPTGPTVTLDDADFDKIDATNTTTVAAGDIVDLQCIGSASAAGVNAVWSCIFTPTTAGKIPMLSGTNNNISTSITEYNFLNGASNWTSTRTDREFEVYNETITVTDLYVRLQTAPTGAGKFYDFDIFKDAVSQITLRIEDTATTGSNTGSVSYNNNTMSIECDPTAGPTVGDCWWGIAFTFAGGGGGGGRIMGSLAGEGGLAGAGGIAGQSGGLAG